MNRQRRRRTSRGAVMIEFVFILPILGGLTALIFFFGWSLMNQLHVKSAARYSAWRHVRGGDPTGMEINRDFFRNAADPNSVSIGYSSGGQQTLQDFVAEVNNADQAAGALAQTLAIDMFPKGSQAEVSAAFPTDIRMWQAFQGSIHSQRGREGVEWRRGQAELMHPVADQFFNQLDATLDNVPGSGRPLGQMVRQLYLAHW